MSFLLLFLLHPLGMHSAAVGQHKSKIAKNSAPLPLRNDNKKSSTLTATSQDADRTQPQQPTDGPWEYVL
jgi:hypothetical protein